MSVFFSIIKFKFDKQRMLTQQLNRQPGCIKNKKADQEQYQCRKAQEINLSFGNLTKFPLTLATQYLKSLKLDNNNISEIVFDYCLPIVSQISLQYNRLKKLSIRAKYPEDVLKFQAIQVLNISHNDLTFLNLTQLANLRELACIDNSLETVIVPINLQLIDISHNCLSNAQYSLLGSKKYDRLKSLNISHNKLYDLILGINGQQLVPSLQHLDCSNNNISYLQNIPQSVTHFNISNNQLLFDRATLNQIFTLLNLCMLNISGNSCSTFNQNLIKSKLGNALEIVSKEEIYDETLHKQSPYKLYADLQAQNMSHTQKSATWNFTLGDCSLDQIENIDPIYKIGSEEESKVITTPEKSLISKPTLTAFTKQKTFRYRVKAYESSFEQPRYENHYKFYLSSLLEYSMIPCRPIRHQEKNDYISMRIDPPTSENIINQFSLFNEMFAGRGGVHYVRKVYKFLPQAQKYEDYHNFTLVFLSRDFSKAEFLKMCEGDYSLLQEENDRVSWSKHEHNCYPNGFTCYHVLMRQNIKRPSLPWGCLYLVQTVHL